MITIGRLAAYAGVTIKAVRHYHRRGLLDEPPRDASGYRRYSAEDAVDLVKIRTLAEAGVPLARIKDLLAADPDRFTAEVAELDRALRERAEALHRTRERLATLTAGDRLFVSTAVADYLEHLAAIGASRRAVRTERDLWILLQAASPTEADHVFADKRSALEDEEFQALYLAYDEAFDWPSDDPRIPALAARARRWFDGRATLEHPPPEAVARLIASSSGASSPAWDRLAFLNRRPDA